MPHNADGIDTQKAHDPVLLEVLRNELEALVHEVRNAVRKTGRSPLVKVGDFGFALCDATSRGIGIGVEQFSHPVLYDLPRRVLDKYGAMEQGDVFITNDPYGGSAHLPDVFLVAPLYHKGTPAAFGAVYSHHSDIGGRFAGGGSGQSTDIFSEGIRIPLLRLSRSDSIDSNILELLTANVRTPDDMVGDISAKISGLWKAEGALDRIIDKYGLDAFQSCSEWLNRRSRQIITAELAAIPDGEYFAEVPIWDDGLGKLQEPLWIRVTLKIMGDKLLVDFTGTDPQAGGAINCPFANACGAVASSICHIVAPEASLNGGFFEAVTIVAPLGTLVNPSFPAAVAGRAPLMFALDELMHLAFAKVIPDRVPVVREGYDAVHFEGMGEGGPFAVLDVISGGWGGRPRSDGLDGVAMTNSSAIPVEILERDYPIVVEGFGLVPDSGGPGKFRGSLGVFRRYRFTESGNIMVRSNRVVPTKGVAKGKGGWPSRTFLERGSDVIEMPQACYIHLEVTAGDVLYHSVAGAGGYGDPLLRDQSSIGRDVIEGRITPQQAVAEYGFAGAPGSSK